MLANLWRLKNRKNFVNNIDSEEYRLRFCCVPQKNIDSDSTGLAWLTISSWEINFRKRVKLNLITDKAVGLVGR